MSSIKFSLFLILAATLDPITTSLSDSKATSPPKFIQPIVFDLQVNSSSALDTRFEKEIGQVRGVQTLASANQFVLDILYQGQKPPGKNYSDVVAIVESFSQTGVVPDKLVPVASTVANRILVNSDHMLNFYGEVRSEFTGIMYHESTHVWQWNGNGTAPYGLITGIADYVRLKAGWPAVNWGPRGSGYQWDHGYEVTAYFLEYLNTLRNGTVAELNGMMKYYYNDALFASIFGKNVEVLWLDYKGATLTSSGTRAVSLETVYLIMHLLPCLILLPWPTNARYRV